MDEPINRALMLIQDSVAQFIASLPALVVALIVFFLIYRAAKPLGNLVEKAIGQTGYSSNVQLVIARLTRWVVILLAFLIAATVALPDFNPSELISLLGVSSVAIGFAFRDILQNFLSGILILVTEPFKINDQIIVGDYEGTVEDIQIRATMLRTYDNRRVVIPNGEIFTDSVIVNTAFNKRRSQYDIGISYSDDIAAAQQLCLDVLAEVDGVMKNPAPDTIMMEMGDSAIIFRVRWWTNPRQADLLRVQDTALRTMKNRLTEAGFDIPFPIRTVYMHQNTSD